MHVALRVSTIRCRCREYDGFPSEPLPLEVRTCSMVPFRAIRERGFAAVGDEPVLVMEVESEERCEPGRNRETKQREAPKGANDLYNT